MGAINELRTMFPIPRVVSRDLPISPKFLSRSPGRYAVFALKHQEAIKRVLQPLEDMFQDHDRLKSERGLEFKLQGKITGIPAFQQLAADKRSRGKGLLTKPRANGASNLS